MRGIYTDAILKTIASRPGLLCVEIADQVGCEVEDVERSIKDEIDAGRVWREASPPAPNGKRRHAYWMTGSLRTPEAKPVPAGEAKPAAAPKSPEATSPKTPAAGRTKVELAMDFIRSKPSQEATDAEMREVMSLRKDQFPSTFLSTQRANGEIHKEGLVWKLGPRVEVSEATRANIRKVLNGEFRCAVWSDGELHLARGDQTVMQLTPAETQKLRMFLANAVVAP